MDPFGEATISRPWDVQLKDETKLDVAIRKLRVHFQFLKKLGVEYYTFHDRDMSPEKSTIEETNKNLDILVKEAKKLQKETGLKLLWTTSNLFSNKRYMNKILFQSHGFRCPAGQKVLGNWKRIRSRKSRLLGRKGRLPSNFYSFINRPYSTLTLKRK